jgi:hypothetical protein
LLGRVMGNEIIRGKLLSNDGELTLVVLALGPSAVKSDRLLGKIEAEARKIAVSRGTTAVQRMCNLVTSVKKAHCKQYMFDRKLHELIEAAMIENWTIMREHNHRLRGMLKQIIASGMAAGEFYPGDAALAARLVNTACLRFCHPRLMAEYEQEPEPALDRMLDFCQAALVRAPV